MSDGQEKDMTEKITTDEAEALAARHKRAEEYSAQWRSTRSLMERMGIETHYAAGWAGALAWLADPSDEDRGKAVVDKFEPPAGWFIFGTHAGPDAVPQMEFYGVDPEDGMPLWERPAPSDEDREALARVLHSAGDATDEDRRVTARQWANLTAGGDETAWHARADAALAWFADRQPTPTVSAERLAALWDEAAHMEVPEPNGFGTVRLRFNEKAAVERFAASLGVEVTAARQPAPVSAETLRLVAQAVRRNCTPSPEAYRAGGDALVEAVADWIENLPEWVSRG